MARTVFGTTLDIAPAVRDTVLAGVFASLVTWAATQEAISLLFGLGSGGLLGFVLHLLPPEPEPDDSRSGRIAVRCITGGITGLCLAPGLAWFAHGAMFHAAAAPSTHEMVRAGVYGLAVGFAWYFIWGVWETRTLRAVA